MFITPGTIVSQLFWFGVCFITVFVVIAKVFIPRIQLQINKRQNHFQCLEDQIDHVVKTSIRLNEQIQILEMDLDLKLSKQRHSMLEKLAFDLRVKKDDIEKGYHEQQTNILHMFYKAREQALLDIEQHVVKAIDKLN